jgi:hypothetical protein
MALRYNGVDRIREGYRRHQARAPVEPTPERQSKAAGIGHKVVVGARSESS